MADQQHKVHHSNNHAEPMRAGPGMPYPHAPPTMSQHTYALQAGHDSRYGQYHQTQNHDMGRLEALVAVATSEGAAVENRS